MACAARSATSRPPPGTARAGDAKEVAGRPDAVANPQGAPPAREMGCRRAIHECDLAPAPLSAAACALRPSRAPALGLRGPVDLRDRPRGSAPVSRSARPAPAHGSTRRGHACPASTEPDVDQRYPLPVRAQARTRPDPCRRHAPRAPGRRGTPRSRPASSAERRAPPVRTTRGRGQARPRRTPVDARSSRRGPVGGPGPDRAGRAAGRRGPGVVRTGRLRGDGRDQGGDGQGRRAGAGLDVVRDEGPVAQHGEDEHGARVDHLDVGGPGRGPVPVPPRRRRTWRRRPGMPPAQARGDRDARQDTADGHDGR
jgi:hypothetical protein